DRRPRGCARRAVCAVSRTAEDLGHRHLARAPRPVDAQSDRRARARDDEADGDPDQHLPRSGGRREGALCGAARREDPGCGARRHGRGTAKARPRAVHPAECDLKPAWRRADLGQSLEALAQRLRQFRARVARAEAVLDRPRAARLSDPFEGRLWRAVDEARLAIEPKATRRCTIMRISDASCMLKKTTKIALLP